MYTNLKFSAHLRRLASVCLTLFLLVGCSGSSSKKEKVEEPDPSELKKLTFKPYEFDTLRTDGSAYKYVPKKLSSIISEKEMDYFKELMVKECRFHDHSLYVLDLYVESIDEAMRSGDSESEDSESDEENSEENESAESSNKPDWSIEQNKDTAFFDTKEDFKKKLNLYYHVFSERYPNYNPVIDKLYKKRLNCVFGFDLSSPNLRNNDFIYWSLDFFYFIEEWKNEDSEATKGKMDGITLTFLEEEAEPTNAPKNQIYFSLTNPFFIASDVSLKGNMSFNYEIDIDTTRAEKTEEELTVRDYLYDDFLEDDTLEMDSSSLAEMYHMNNFLFYESKSSFDLMMDSVKFLADDNHNSSECYDYYKFFNNLYELFGYDKQPRINKMLIDERLKTSDSYDWRDCDFGYGIRHFFANKDVFGNLQIRTGMMETLLEGSFDSEDKNLELRREDYLIENGMLLDVFQSYEKYILSCLNSEVMGFYTKEEFRTIAAYTGYYLMRSYQRFLSLGQKIPSNWNCCFGKALYDEDFDQESKLYKYIRKKKFFGLEHFEELSAFAYKEARYLNSFAYEAVAE